MVKVIPQEEIKERESPVSVALFWFSIIVFITTAGLFFIFHLNIQKTNEELAGVRRELKQIDNEEKQNLRRQAYEYKNKIDIIPNLLETHLLSSKVFRVIEENIHPQVVFNSFSLVTKERRVVLSGFSQDIISLAQQIRIFEREKTNIEMIKLANTEITEGGRIGFKIDIFFTDKSFLRQNETP